MTSLISDSSSKEKSTGLKQASLLNKLHCLEQVTVLSKYYACACRPAPPSALGLHELASYCYDRPYQAINLRWLHSKERELHCTSIQSVLTVESHKKFKEHERLYYCTDAKKWYTEDNDYSSSVVLEKLAWVWWFIWWWFIWWRHWWWHVPVPEIVDSDKGIILY